MKTNQRVKYRSNDGTEKEVYSPDNQPYLYQHNIILSSTLVADDVVYMILFSFVNNHPFKYSTIAELANLELKLLPANGRINGLNYELVSTTEWIVYALTSLTTTKLSIDAIPITTSFSTGRNPVIDVTKYIPTVTDNVLTIPVIVS